MNESCPRPSKGGTGHRRPSSEYSYEPLNRTIHPSEYVSIPEVALWFEYRRQQEQASGPNLALEALLLRHEKLLKSLAQKAYERHRRWTEFDDQFSHATLGAIHAYDHFNVEKAQAAGAKLSTYVYLRVSNWLKTMVDEDAFIQCPQGFSTFRSYLSGKYDNDLEKKRQFEEKHGIKGDDDIADLKDRFALLNPEIYSLDSGNTYLGEEAQFDFRADDRLGSEEHLRHLEITMQMEKLSDRRKQVMDLYFMQRFSMEEIADHLGLSLNEVRGDIRAIRRTIN